MAPVAALSQERVVDTSSEDDSNSSANEQRDISHNNDQLESNSEAESSDDSSEASSISENNDSSAEVSKTSVSQSKMNGVKRKAQLPEPASNNVHKKSKSSSRPARVPARPYQPPAGYEPISLASVDLESVTNLGDLQGKQIWHITAPIDVPITTIKSLNLQAVLRCDPVLEHNGAKYGLHEMPLTPEVLLLPNGPDAEYKKAGAPISRNLHLQETISIANHTQHGSKGNTTTPQSSQTGARVSIEKEVTFTTSAPGVKKPPRPQVKGLMMRYHPFGSGAEGKIRMGDLNGTDEQNVAGAIQSNFIVPAEISSDADDLQRVQSPKKIKKAKQKDKYKSPKSSQTVVDSQDAMDVDTPQNLGQTGTTREHKKKKDRKGMV